MPPLRGTRAPEGASLPAARRPGIYREVELWPGVTWGRDARCLCSWAVRYGVMQVKVASAACTVHVAGRTGDVPASPPGPLPADLDAALLAACRAGTVTQELYDAAAARWRAGHESAVLAALLRPRLAELADLLLGEPAPAGCPCGSRGPAGARARRCARCRPRRRREDAARHLARKRRPAR